MRLWFTTYIYHYQHLDYFPYTMNKFISSLFAALLCIAALNAASINVVPGSGTLKTAVTNATAGDVLVLENGEYTESSLKPTVALTIKAANGAKPVIKLSSRFEVKADFTIQGVTIESTGEAIRMVSGNSVYNVTATDCQLSGCPSYFIRAYNTEQSAPYINTLTIDNCLFLMGSEASNTARAVAATKAPVQLRSLLVRNSTFNGGTFGTGRMIYLHSGNEDTAIPLEGTCLIDHCTFYNSNNTRGVYPANINGCHITNCIFMNAEERSGAVSFALYGSDSKIENSLCWNAPIKLGTGATQTACLSRDPWFVDAEAGNFQLSKNSAAVGVGTDGSNLGDPRWGVSDNDHDTSADAECRWQPDDRGSEQVLSDRPVCVHCQHEDPGAGTYQFPFHESERPSE